MSGADDGDEVHLSPTMRQSLAQILAHAASQERTVVEFRTTETESGYTHLSHAVDITEYVATLENNSEELPEK